MELNNTDSKLDAVLFNTLENILTDYISQVYIKFKDYDKSAKIDVFKYIINRESNEEKINPYCLYSLFIMDLVDSEMKKDNFFDQEHRLVPIKTNHKDGNEFMCNNEIYTVLNELKTWPEKFIIVKQIFSRIRSLSILNIWNANLDIDSFAFDNEESSNFKSELKTYLLNHPKYLRYGHLLKVALDRAKTFEHPEPIPRNMKEFQQFLKNPLIYVTLEPYNHIY
jgi:hypothetical protein